MPGEACFGIKLTIHTHATALRIRMTCRPDLLIVGNVTVDLVEGTRPTVCIRDSVLSRQLLAM